MTKPTFMFTTLFLLLASFSRLQLAATQTLADLPGCAIACLVNAAASNGCGPTDINCACASEGALRATISCIFTTCPREDRSSSQGILQEICQAAPPPTTSSSVSSAQTSASSPPAASPSSSSTGSVSSATTPTPTLSSASTTQTSTSTATARPVASSISRGFARSSSTSGPSVVVVVQTIAPTDETGLLSGANALTVSLIGCGVAVAVSALGMGVGAGLLL